MLLSCSGFNVPPPATFRWNIFDPRKLFLCPAIFYQGQRRPAEKQGQGLCADVKGKDIFAMVKGSIESGFALGLFPRFPLSYALLLQQDQFARSLRK